MSEKGHRIVGAKLRSGTPGPRSLPWVLPSRVSIRKEAFYPGESFCLDAPCFRDAVADPGRTLSVHLTRQAPVFHRWQFDMENDLVHKQTRNLC